MCACVSVCADAHHAERAQVAGQEAAKQGKPESSWGAEAEVGENPLEVVENMVYKMAEVNIWESSE